MGRVNRNTEGYIFVNGEEVGWVGTWDMKKDKVLRLCGEEGEFIGFGHVFYFVV